MKKLTCFFLLIIVVGETFIISCKKSSSTSVKDPTIHFIAGTGYTSSDQTVQLSTPLLFGISATAGDGKLSRFLVIRTFQGKTTTAKDSSFSATSFNYDLHMVAMGTVGTETWIFTIFDNNGGSAAATLTITTTPPTSAGPIFSNSRNMLVTQTK